MFGFFKKPEPEIKAKKWNLPPALYPYGKPMEPFNLTITFEGNSYNYQLQQVVGAGRSSRFLLTAPEWRIIRFGFDEECKIEVAGVIKRAYSDYSRNDSEINSFLKAMQPLFAHIKQRWDEKENKKLQKFIRVLDQYDTSHIEEITDKNQLADHLSSPHSWIRYAAAERYKELSENN